MGQQQATVSKPPSLLHHTTHYESDPRLIQYKNTLPSYFSAIAEKSVHEITAMINSIPQHNLEPYLINAIDTRFQRHHSTQDSQQDAGQPREWFQLANQQRFLNLLRVFTRQYAVEHFIHLEYQKKQPTPTENANAFQTLRNPIKVPVIPTLSEELIIRMLLGFYLKLIKTYANSGEKHTSRFHEQTGRQLCLMILKGHLSLAQLYGLFYQFVYIDKHPQQVTSKLGAINKSYHWQCLRTQYSINVEKKQLDRIQTTARLYLDQLYLSSLREAEDPEIKNSDDTLLPIKLFPISRVKDKPRS